METQPDFLNPHQQGQTAQNLLASGPLQIGRSPSGQGWACYDRAGNFISMIYRISDLIKFSENACCQPNNQNPNQTT
jgi:hypothetical protein